jgi:hypothetical protein
MDPATGRFQSKDPFPGLTSQPKTLQRFSYAGNYPIGFTDPTGRYWGENVVNTVTNAAGDVASDAGHVAQDGLHIVLDVAAVPPYLEYYLSYNALGALNDFGDQYGTAGTVTSRVVGSPLVLSEGVGLGLDVAIDAVKGHTVNHESICDEGVQGPINPLHDYLPGGLIGPIIYLPGIHSDGSVDWEW